MERAIPAEASSADASPRLPRITMNALPAPISSFVGREDDLVALARLLDAGRLVTLTGPGGSGKTRLAIQFAGARTGLDGFTFVDLSSITDPEQIVGSIAAALGFRDTTRADLAESLLEALGNRRVCLLLDSLEHLPPAGSIIAGLMTRWPTLTVLATSRAPLHVLGEQIYPLGPMELPTPPDLASLDRLERVDAVQLFVERARSVNPAFELTRANAPVVAEICVRLEGIPLAIELAAARSRVLSPPALLGQLEPLLPFLTGGPTHVPLRQQTIQATIAWSFQLLGSEERRCLASLGVFVGGFTVAACEAVATDGEEVHAAPTVLAMLERLVDQSLLGVRPGPDGGPRFGMLETIREFALGQVSPAKERVLRDRHAAYFLDQAEDTDRASRGPEQISRIRQLVADQANVRAALAWSLDAGHNEALARLAAALDEPFWYEAGGLREGLSWLESAANLASPRLPRVRVRLLQRAGWIAREIGLHERAGDMVAASLVAATEGSDEAGLAEAMFFVAHRSLDEETPELDVAGSRLADAYAHAEHAGAARLMGQIRVDQGDVARRRGDVRAARSCYEDAIDLARRAGDAAATAYALLQLGGLDRSIGDSGRAIGSLAESMRLSGEVGDKALLHWAMFALARTLLEAGDLAAARAQIQDGARVLEEIRGNNRECILALAVTSEWLAAAGRMPAAVEGWATAARGRRDQTRAMPSHHRKALEQGYARATKVLGPVRFHRHWVIGEHRDPHEALDRALVEVGSVDLAGRPPASPVIADRYALTGRELEVTALVAAGMSDGEIAESLVISKKTASVHVANIKAKLGARTRVEIAIVARLAGLD